MSNDGNDRGIFTSAADDEAAALRQLRSLLVGPEQEELTQLRERIEDPQLHAEDIGKVLPQAIRHRLKQDDQLVQALSPAVEQSLKASVERNPQPLVDAIFPVIGPAIRRSIADTLARMVENLNQALEHSFSPRSWRWRLEAWRTKRPYAEIVLLRTLIYRVEQVFLIHGATGLPLQHVVAPGVAEQDATLVSGMITAIRDFVHDSFGKSRGDEGDELDEFRIGEHTIRIAQGPEAFLAAVVRGKPPTDLNDRLTEIIETVHRDASGLLSRFKGDAAPFELVRPTLEKALLEARIQPKAQPQKNAKKKRLPPLFWAGLAAAVLGIGYWVYLRVDDDLKWSSAVQSISLEPGVIVLSSGGGRGHHYVTGLRDPLSGHVLSLIANAGIDPNTVTQQWAPFVSFHEPFILIRAQRLLAAPPTIDLSIKDGTLRARGSADAGWIANSRRLAPLLPGVSAWDDHEVVELRPTTNPVSLMSPR